MSNAISLTRSASTRRTMERVIIGILIACSLAAIFTTVGIVLSLIFEAYRFFEKIPASEFFFGLNWSPQTAIRSDQVGASVNASAKLVTARTWPDATSTRWTLLSR